MAKELKKVTKKAKTTKPTKTSKATKATKATKTTKTAKVTKTTKKELSAKDRKKVTGGKNVNNRLASFARVALGLSTAGAAKGGLKVKDQGVRVNQRDLIVLGQQLRAEGYSPEEIEEYLDEVQKR